MTLASTIPLTAHGAIDDSFEGLRIRRVAGHIGGEVLDLRLDAALDDAQIANLEAALVRHKVLFFRGQSHLTNASHEAFGARLGRTVAHPKTTLTMQGA